MIHGIAIEDAGMSKSLLSHKPAKLLIILALILFVSLPIVRPFELVTAQTSDQNQFYTREFAWDYGGNHWVWNLSIPVSLYEAYKAVPDATRTRNGPAGYDMMVTTKDSYIQDLTEKLNETANQQGYGPVDKINFVLAFVQSIPYSTDLNSTGYEEYPRFPIEVLVDQTGDCDCKSDLFATLTLDLGYGAVFINPPDHLAVGVLGNNLQGTYWTYQNQTYYYAETTGVGFKVGDLPDVFKDQTAYVYPIDENNQYIVNSQAQFTVAPNPTISPHNTQATATPNSGTTPTSPPDITQPTIQPAQPISLNLISDYPILFIVIVAAIAFSIVITVKTASNPKLPKSKQTISTEPTVSPLDQPNTSETKLLTKVNVEATKFCIYCGSSNKSFALYCVRCGKKID